jgi:metal-responsive CopG/Arc/MetJ family transcriptional regulator
VEFKVLPLRMEVALVEQLDAARKRQGLRSRMDLIRRALQAFLAAAGEAEVAALLATEQ